VDRREFLNISMASAAGMMTGSLQLSAERRPDKPGRVRAIAFDGFVIFDVRAVATRAEEVLTGKSNEFVNLWRTRQFEYSWLRTAGQQYRDFWHVTEEALIYAANSMKLSLSPEQRDRLMGIYRELPVWPDVPDALALFRESGIKLAFLSNFTAAMLDANLARAKLNGFFQDHLTTDRVRLYKPSPHAYQMGVDAFKLKREEIAFAAFGGWDAAGAKWFGYPTVWVNRTNGPVEELSGRPDVITTDISGLVTFVGS
jgi:2-haloacid dehalogenase